MLELIKQPWHWAVAGTLIGLIVPLLLLMGNKKLGVSSSMRHLCAICMPNNISFFKYDWKKEIWNLFFVVGIFLGGFIAANYLTDPNGIVIAEGTKEILAGYGITDFSQMMPVQIFSFENIFTLRGWLHKRTFHNGNSYFSATITYCNVLFYDWRFFHGECFITNNL